MLAGHSGFEQEYDEEGNLISRKYQNGGNLLNRIDGYAEARWIKNAETGACDLTFIDAAGSEVSSNGLNLARDIPGDDENWSAWMRPSYNAVNSCMSIGRLNLGEKLAGDVYTCQIEIEFKGVQATQGQDFRFWTQGSADGDWYKGNVWTSNLTYLDTAPADGIYSFTVTNAVNENMVGVSNFDMGFRCDNWSAGYFRVRKIKVEKGDQVSEWSPGV